MSVLLIVLVVVLVLWFLSLVAARSVPQLAVAAGWLPFIAVVILTLMVAGGGRL